MGYKKNFWYISGVILALLSAAVMLVTMIIMYFGSNVAIIVFFAACVPFVTGVLLAGAVKRRYAEAEMSGKEPLPMFYTVRYLFYRLRCLFAEKGVVRVMLTGFTVLSFAITLCFAGFCGHHAYKRHSIETDGNFVNNKVLYEEYYSLWVSARGEGDEEAAHGFFETMEKYNSDNAVMRGMIKKHTEELKKNAAVTVFSGAVTVFFFTLSAVCTVRSKNKRRAK